ncbi:hypothetical protein RFI_37013 [Reticulomyxa filosa]|uniref:Uncharacterized protein n=1 Tax=Reticulomyxa filosa TaxID=46433 RepID=X6LEN5_RETFI|nr:hypothetical protein RFI_37013 [Reticulomyxa filosa]|eukprot:ETO00433.1 hypothetical protein RFI_37013 [Reticulomyxa filosa]
MTEKKSDEEKFKHKKKKKTIWRGVSSKQTRLNLKTGRPRKQKKLNKKKKKRKYRLMESQLIKQKVMLKDQIEEMKKKSNKRKDLAKSESSDDSKTDNPSVVQFSLADQLYGYAAIEAYDNVAIWLGVCLFILFYFFVIGLQYTHCEQDTRRLGLLSTTRSCCRCQQIQNHQCQRQNYTAKKERALITYTFSFNFNFLVELTKNKPPFLSIVFFFEEKGQDITLPFPNLYELFGFVLFVFKQRPFTIHLLFTTSLCKI